MIFLTIGLISAQGKNSLPFGGQLSFLVPRNSVINQLFLGISNKRLLLKSESLKRQIEYLS